MTIDDLNAKEQLKQFVIPNINATKTVDSSWELNSLNNDKTGSYISLSMEQDIQRLSEISKRFSKIGSMPKLKKLSNREKME